jgi:hypothetical protein
VNSHVDKLFGKGKRIDYFITVCVVMWRDDEHKTAVKENNGNRWSSDGVVLWLGWRQNKDVVEW